MPRSWEGAKTDACNLRDSDGGCCRLGRVGLQVCAPIYKLVMTNLGGEQRFAAAVARRLQSLGALTRGDRRAASGVDLSESNFDSPLGRKSLRWVGAPVCPLLGNPFWECSGYPRLLLLDPLGRPGHCWLRTIIWMSSMLDLLISAR